MYPPPPPREKSFARAIFMTLATTIFGLSLALNVYLLLFSGLLGAGSGSRQNVISDGDVTQTVAVIPVTGTILAETSAKFDRFLSLAEKDANVKAVVIEIDSPGGTVTASDEIYERILKFRAAKPGVPVVASMASLGASGGYYVACAASDVFAQKTTITGSIGVMMPNYNFSGLMEKWGITDNSIIASGADFKDIGSPTKPPNPAQVQHLQQLADDMFTQFKSIVTTSRGGLLTAPISDIANGKVFLGDEAKKLGLVDHVGYLSDACAMAASKAALNRPQIVRYVDPPTIFEIFSADSPVPPANLKSVNVNGVNVNVDLKGLSDLVAPRMMYLWRGQ
jgi:protease-4